MQPHRWQPTRLPHPWDSPGKNTGVGCHFLLQCMKVKSESEVAQSCPTISDPMDCSLPGSSVHGIFQARVLEWGAIAFSQVHTTMHQIGKEHEFTVQLREFYLISCISLSRDSSSLTCAHVYLLSHGQFFQCHGPYPSRLHYSWDSLGKNIGVGCPTLCDPQHARPPCPSPAPGVHSNSCPLIR